MNHIQEVETKPESQFSVWPFQPGSHGEHYAEVWMTTADIVKEQMEGYHGEPLEV